MIRALRLARRGLLAAIVLALTAVWLQYHASVARLLVTDLHYNDFGKVYYSALAWRDGERMYAPSPATLMPIGQGRHQQFWNLNPPHVHLALLPLTRLPPLAGLICWAAASGAALVASLLLIARELGIRWTWWRVMLTLLGVVVASPTGAMVLTGQMGYLLLLPMTLAWRWARHDRWTGAAVMLGLLASAKPFLGVFLIYLAVSGRARAAGAMLTTIVMCFGAGLAVFGWAPHGQWLDVVARVDWTWAVMNGSIAGLLSRSLDASPYFTPLVQAPMLASAVWLVGSSALFALSMRRLHVTTPTTDGAFATLALVGLLAGPLGWIYYLPLAAPGLAGVWNSARPTRWHAAALVLAAPGLVLPPDALLIARDSWLGTLTIGSAFAWTTLLLWSAVIATYPRAPE